MAAMMTAGVSGTTKKFAFTAAYQLGYTVGNFLGPQTYRASDAPNYYVSIEYHIHADVRHTKILKM